MNTWIALAATLALAAACSTAPKAEWQRADVGGDPAAMSEQRSKDIADCMTRVGAPTVGTVSPIAVSKSEVEDCMRAKGWRRAPGDGG
jgi:hypothetical protein